MVTISTPTTPYDVPAMIAAVANFMASTAGQEALIRLMGDAGITLNDLNAKWAEREKAQAPLPPKE